MEHLRFIKGLSGLFCSPELELLEIGAVEDVKLLSILDVQVQCRRAKRMMNVRMCRYA